MTIPDTVKIPLLKEFHTRLYDPEWKFMDSNEKDKVVLQEFPTVSKIITKRMMLFAQ